MSTALTCATCNHDEPYHSGVGCRVELAPAAVQRWCPCVAFVAPVVPAVTRRTALELVHTEALALADLMQTMPFWDGSDEVAAQLARLQRALRAATDVLVVAKAGG